MALGGLMTGGDGAPCIFHRRRQRGFMVGGVRPQERALKQRTRWTGVFFLVLQGSATLPGAEKLTEYACCAQFHSRNEFLEAHINAMLNVEGTLI